MLLLSPVGGAVPCKYTSCRRPDSQRFLYRRSCPRLGRPQVVCNAKPLFGQVIDFEDSCVVHAKSLLCVSNILFAYGHCLRILNRFRSLNRNESCLDDQRHQRGDCPQLKPSASGGRAQLKEPEEPLQRFGHQMVVPKKGWRACCFRA